MLDSILCRLIVVRTNASMDCCSRDRLCQGENRRRKINPEITETDKIGLHVGRLRHAQPIWPPGFAAMIPPTQRLDGLQIADTCFYYPEDLGIAESVRLGKEMAERIR